jgi:hypothetical protein
MSQLRPRGREFTDEDRARLKAMCEEAVAANRERHRRGEYVRREDARFDPNADYLYMGAGYYALAE